MKEYSRNPATQGVCTRTRDHQEQIRTLGKKLKHLPTNKKESSRVEKNVEK